LYRSLSGLSPEGIEKLSPSAAAASKLLKTGMSLTQVFSQLVSCQEELLAAKDENTRLNSYLEQILKVRTVILLYIVHVPKCRF
jgi:hypothetical protein